MSWLLSSLPPSFDAALRDVRARTFEARLAAAERLGDPDEGRESEALDGLIVMCRDLDARVRASALRGLVGHDDLRVADLLIAALDDGEPLVREVALVALGSVPGERARLAVLEALGSEYPELRFQAVESYLERHEEPELAVIAPLLTDPDPRVRENAALVMHRLGPGAVVPLRAALEDAVPRVRHRVALSLARLGESDGGGPLLAALHDPELTLAVLDVLPTLAERGSLEPVAQIAQALLRPPTLKVAAARTLCRCGDPRGVQALRGVMRALRRDGRSYAVEVVGQLQLAELGDELLRLARRARGTDPTTLATALSALQAASPAARRGLELMSHRLDEAGQLARAALQTTA